MTDILFYGILIVLALGILSFLTSAVLGWLRMIFWFVVRVFQFAWKVVTIPFSMIRWVMRLGKPKKQREREEMK
ncbi:hypothetical protein D478_24503 [Brevibacillus agri BAB-2500]|nr:hypothetical protein D478_24503 [Brevibacillus agri BAB-2500]